MRQIKSTTGYSFKIVTKTKLRKQHNIYGLRKKVRKLSNVTSGS